MKAAASPPVVLDARRAGAVPVTAVVAGVPLIVRTLRGCARAGVGGVEIWTADKAGRAGIGRALADYPVPPALAVTIEIAGERPAPPGALDATAIYSTDALAGAGADPVAPALTVREPADVAVARRHLFAGIRKPMQMDGVIAYYLQRPMSRVVTRLLLDTPVTANQATLLALLCGVAAAVIAAGGARADFAVAGVLYFLSGVIDCVDGELARLRVESSRVGEWLDSMTDEITTLSLLIGIGVGLSRAGASPWWMWATIGAAGVATVALGRLYLELHRLGATIDTAHFPWFFRDTSGGEVVDTRATSAFGWVMIGLGYLIRRDANVTGISLLLVLGLAKLAAALTIIAVSVVAVLTAVHFALRR